MKSLVTKRTVSAGPTGVVPLRIWSTTAVVPEQWNVIFRPETWGKRPVATSGLQTGLNPLVSAVTSCAPVSVSTTVWLPNGSTPDISPYVISLTASLADGGV